MMRTNLLFAFAAGLLSWSPAACAIETVDNLEVSKYLGRWYQASGHQTSSHKLQGHDITGVGRSMWKLFGMCYYCSY